MVSGEGELGEPLSHHPVAVDACANDPQQALDLYEWNIAASAAFWEVIAVTEVVMRNAMHDRLTNTFGTRWYDDSSILDDRSLRAVR